MLLYAIMEFQQSLPYLYTAALKEVYPQLPYTMWEIAYSNST